MIEAYVTLFTTYQALFCLLGVILGIVVGAMPGLSGSMLIALALPFTFYMESADALVLLVSMFVGSVSGGLLTAILLRIPGDPSAIMTTFDGYPMAAKGEARRALALAIFASFVGGSISWVVLVTFTRPLSRYAVIFGPFEYFALVVLALSLIVSVSGKSLSKGLLAASLGGLAAMPGVDVSTGHLRLTFGVDALEGGFSTLSVFIGMFAINQVLTSLVSQGELGSAIKHRGMALVRRTEMAGQWLNLLRSSGIGILIGILPGVGATVASLVSYSVAKGASRRPEIFGTGCPDGIIASEAANNGSIGGSLIPLIALGIPGSVTGAILVGALILHGLQPGPLLFVTNPGIVETIYATTFVANLLMFLLLVLIGGVLCRIALIPFSFLAPMVVLSCILGAFAQSSRVFDIWTVLGFGVVGYVMEKKAVPLGPFVIAFVLMPSAESYFRSALMMSAGNPAEFVERPISAILLSLSLLSLAWSLARHRRKP